PEFFPAVFGPEADQPLDADIVRARFADLSKQVKAETGRDLSPADLAEGFVAIAVQNMAEAIKAISISRGHDVTGYALNCFGGAGGQHACLVADALGMTTVMLHPFAGVLSAYGMGLAEVRAIRQATAALPLSAAHDTDLAARIRELETAARAELTAQGFSGAALSALPRAEIKYAGTDTPLTVPFGPSGAMAAAFEAAHRRRFGFVAEGKPLVVETLEVEAVAASDQGAGDLAPPAATSTEPVARVPVRMAGADHDTPVWRREHLDAHAAVDGP